MKVYYEEENIQIYNADCLEVLPQLEKVDLCLTDPPYGIGFVYQEKEKTNNPEDYHKFIMPFFNEMKRVSKKFVAMAQATKYMRYFWQWYGDNIRIFIGYKTFVSLRNTFMNYAYEPWVFYLQKDIDIRINGKPDRNLDWVKCDTAGLRNPNNLERQHPSPKPVSMLKAIINNFTNPNDLILDPFLGSGTTAVACKELGRRCIGIEINSTYCDIAIKRLKNTQKDLFL